jgi:hypothetical protein
MKKIILLSLLSVTACKKQEVIIEEERPKSWTINVIGQNTQVYINYEPINSNYVTVYEGDVLGVESNTTPITKLDENGNVLGTQQTTSLKILENNKVIKDTSCTCSNLIFNKHY